MLGAIGAISGLLIPTLPLWSKLPYSKLYQLYDGFPMLVEGLPIKASSTLSLKDTGDSVKINFRTKQNHPLYISAKLDNEFSENTPHLKKSTGENASIPLVVDISSPDNSSKSPVFTRRINFKSDSEIYSNNEYYALAYLPPGQHIIMTTVEDTSNEFINAKATIKIFYR